MKYFLLGTVVGDICGSRFEWAKPETISPEFKFITKTSRYTDDTVLTMAVAEALIKDRPYDMMIQKFGRRYPDSGYGGMFRKWLFKQGERVPYNSFGNGAAMRLLPVALFYNDLPSVLKAAVLQTACTHNHPDALSASMLLSHAIFLARTVKDKAEIYQVLNKTYGYTFVKPGDPDTRKHSLHAITGVHESLNSFFDSEDFIGTLRNAVVFGGDADTLGCIASSLAYVFYEKIPAELIERVLLIIPEEFRQIIKKFAKITEENYGKSNLIRSKKLF